MPATAVRTIRAYETDWRHFESWAQPLRHPVLPASSEAITRYLASMLEAGYAPSTVRRRLAAIDSRHRRSGHPAPDRTPDLLAVIERTRTQRVRPAPSVQGHRLAIRETAELAHQGRWPRAVSARRDLAVLLLAATGIGPGDIAACRNGDLEIVDDGVRLRLAASRDEAAAFPRAATPSECLPCAVAGWTELTAATDRGAPRSDLMQLVDATRAASSHRCIGEWAALLDPARPLFRQVLKSGRIGGHLSDRGVRHLLQRRTILRSETADGSRKSTTANPDRRSASPQNPDRSDPRSRQRLGHDWELWVDWCRATGRRPTGASAQDIAQFCVDVPAAPGTVRHRVRAIAHGLNDPDGAPGLARPRRGPWRTGPDWLTLGEALRRLPTVGWPSALHGRRDGFLVAVAAVLKLTRSQLRRLGPADVELASGTVRVCGASVDPDMADSLACPACAVTRWLRVLSAATGGGRSGPQRLLMSASQFAADRGHDCAEPVPPGWKASNQLLPAIDRHGWIDDFRPISTRQISSILRQRQARDQAEPTTVARQPMGRTSVPRREPYAEERFDDLLESLEAKVDQLAAQVERVLESLSD